MPVDLVYLGEAVRTLGIHWKKKIGDKIRSLQSKRVDDDQSEAVWSAGGVSVLAGGPVCRCRCSTCTRTRQGKDKLMNWSGARSAARCPLLCWDPPI